MPIPEELFDADVIVAPLEGTPEFKVYSNALESYKGGVIRERDPHKALMMALTYPRRGFRRVVFGIDPGKNCGLAGLGDRFIVHTSYIPCNNVGKEISELKNKIPGDYWEVYVGNGYGVYKAVASLLEAGISYKLVDEHGTTKKTSEKRFTGPVKNRDIISGLAIALRGAYSEGRFVIKIRR